MLSVGPQTQEEFLRGQALHALDRLRDHIERIDEGKAYALDDLAVVLRLLAHPGHGNDLLGRLQRTYSTRPISVLVSRPPEVDGTLFSFGRVPARAGTESLGADTMLFSEWLNTTFLSLQIGERRVRWTWAAFMNRYANKWGGAHLDETVPIELQIVDRYAFGGFSLSTYLLRAAAVVVWKAAQTMWIDGSFARSGAPLEDRELHAMRATSMGRTDDPADRLRYGEPQFLTYTGDSAELVMLMSRHSSCHARLAIGGGLSYDATFKPENAGELPRAVSEPRTPVHAPLRGSDFSEGRSVNLKVRCVVGD